MAAATARHLTPEKLGSIPGLIVPRTGQFGRLALRETVEQSLADFTFPVLLRPAGSHGGRGLSRIDEPTAMAAALDALDSDHVYVTEFHDFASTDGLYRKMRLVFVDHQTFPVHLSMSDHWLNHYFRGRTADDAALRAEEARFLQRPDLYLGDRLYDAMRRVAQVHPLGYFGLDGAVNRNGDLVVFECNATMLVRHKDLPPEHAHKRAAAERVRAAVRDLILKTAR